MKIVLKFSDSDGGAHMNVLENHWKTKGMNSKACELYLNKIIIKKMQYNPHFNPSSF